MCIGAGYRYQLMSSLISWVPKQYYFHYFSMTIGLFQSDMLDPFAGDRVIWYFCLFRCNCYKNTNIFTDFEVWQIENVIKPTYQHRENYLPMCFATSEPRRHTENRNVCTWWVDIHGLFWSLPRTSKHCWPSIVDKMYFCSFDDNKWILTTRHSNSVFG